MILILNLIVMKRILFILLILIGLCSSCSDKYESKFSAVLVIEGYDTQGNRYPAGDEYAIFDGHGYLSFDQDPLDPDLQRVEYFVENEIDLTIVSTFNRIQSDLVLEEFKNHFGKFVRKRQIKYK
jgi:hypothetical protein